MYSRLLPLALLLLIFSSCREEGETVTTNTGNIPPPTIVTATVTTVVLDQNGTPVSDATISGLGGDSRENPDGTFTIDASQLSSDGSMVTVTSPGFWPERRVLVPAGDGEFVEEFIMEPKVKAGDIDPVTGGIITIADNFTIEIPANAVVTTADGQPYDGQIDVYVNHDAPEDFNEMLNSPGNANAMLEDGSMANLESFGMMDIALESPDGTPLELDANNPAQVRMPISPETAAMGPDQVDFWVLDPNGFWLPAGVATLAEDCYVVIIRTSGGYNVDVPRPIAQICGRFMDVGGFPLTHSPFQVNLVGGMSCWNARVDCDGEFCAFVAADVPLEFVLRDSCTGEITTIPFDPVAEGQTVDLGDIVVDLSNTAFIATLTDCSGAGIPDIELAEVWANGYGGNGGRYFAAREDGTSVISLINCGDNEVKVQAFTRDYRASSPVITRAADDSLPEELTVCGELDADEYFNISIDGTDIIITELAPVYWPGNGNYNWLVRAAGMLDGEEYSLFLNFSNPTVGPVNPEDAMGAVYRLEPGQDYGEGRVYVDPDQQLGLTGVLVSEDMFEGTFSATMNLQNDATQTVEAVNVNVTASFRIRL